MRDNGFITWDRSNWSRALSFLDTYKSKSFRNKKILELGGKNASLSLWAASEGGDVICSDIVKQEDTLKKRVRDYKIEFKIVDALDIPYDGYFDFILFKSLLGGVGRYGCNEKQLLVMDQIKKSLKKGGQCLFIENMRGTIFHQIIRKKYGAGKNNWYYPNYDEFKELSNLFSRSQSKTFGMLSSTGRFMKNHRARFDVNFDYLFPKNWRYIYAGIFHK